MVQNIQWKKKDQPLLFAVVAIEDITMLRWNPVLMLLGETVGKWSREIFNQSDEEELEETESKLFIWQKNLLIWEL